MDTLPAYRLRKCEIVRKKQIVNSLFTEGKSYKGRFLRAVYAFPEPESILSGQQISVLFSVAKRVIPAAVRRNRIKRLMREAYRLEKPAQVSHFSVKNGEDSKRGCVVAFLYMGSRKQIPPFELFRTEIRSLLSHICSS